MINKANFHVILHTFTLTGTRKWRLYPVVFLHLICYCFNYQHSPLAFQVLPKTKLTTVNYGALKLYLRPVTFHTKLKEN